MSDKTTSFFKQVLFSSVFLAIVGGAFAFGVDRSFIKESLTNQQTQIQNNTNQITVMKRELSENRELLVTYLASNVEQMKTLNSNITEIKEQLKAIEKKQ